MYDTKEAFFAHLEAIFASEPDDFQHCTGRESTLGSQLSTTHRSKRARHDGMPKTVSIDHRVEANMTELDLRNLEVEVQSRVNMTGTAVGNTSISETYGEQNQGLTSRVELVAIPQAGSISVDTKSSTSKLMFADLVFHFIPASRVNVARNLRMKKVTQLGGTILEKFDASRVTHIIVDQNINLNIVLRTIRVDRIPSTIQLFNEQWTPDCVVLGRLIEFSPKYAVLGSELPTSLRVNSPSNNVDTQETVARSLQIKRQDFVVAGEPETPPPNSLCVPSTVSPSVAFRSSTERLSRTTRPTRLPDELDSAISTIHRLGPVQMEEEEEEEEEEEQEARNGNGDEDHKVSLLSRSAKAQNWQHRFKCMVPNISNTKIEIGPNDFVIAKMQVMQEYYETSIDPGDKWKPRGYRLAIASLRRQTEAISTYEDAIRLPNIGDRLARHIAEIVNTGTFQRAENLGKHFPTIQKFLGVYGVGPRKADEFVQKGYRTLDDLLKYGTLSANQQIGVELYTDLNTRIPRDEVDKHKKLIKREGLKVDADMQIYIMGSYRRGAEDCGDIDILITRKSTSTQKLVTLWQKLLSRLNALHYLTHTLVSSSRRDGLKWQGICRLANPTSLHRRIDFLLVPWEQRGAALLYFTGNDLFNRSIRLLARKKGYTLNEKALLHGALRKDEVKLTTGTNTGAQTEEEIFDILGVPFRPPEERIIS